MTSPPTEQVAATVATYQAATTSLRTNLTNYLTALWESLGTYSNAQMADFIAQAVPVVNGGQQQMASLTSAYLAAHKSAVLGVPLVPVPVNMRSVTGAAVRNGTKPSEVYGRPFHTVWRQLGAAKTQQDEHWNWAEPTDDFPTQPPLPSADFIDKAISSGLDDAISSAVTDLQLTKTHTSQQIVDKDKKASGYRRVLEGAFSCGLCIVASTQRYHKGTLLPIHPACDCSVAPLYTDENPDDEQTIDIPTLSAAHQAVADKFGKSSPAARGISGAFKDNGQSVLYRDVLITHQHGEIGPVLAVRGQKFLGPSDLN